MSYDCTMQLIIREMYYPELLKAIDGDYLARAEDEKRDGVLLLVWPYDNHGYSFPEELQKYLSNVPEEDFLFHLRDEYENFENMGRFLDNPFGMTQTFTITVGQGCDPVKDFFTAMKARYGAEEALKMIEDVLEKEREDPEDGESSQPRP